MQIKESIILAGGFGTRLKSAVPDLPKCMAPVNGRPFLFYIINYLRSQGIQKFIFSLGYKHEIIEAYLKEQFSTLDYQCSTEKEPLGTGGGILAACYKTSDEQVLVVNGDTLFKANIAKAFSFHIKKQADYSLILKPMEKFDRYGTVELNEDGSIFHFSEKKFYKKGFINGGVYILNVRKFLEEELPAKFSFEKDFLEKYHSTRSIVASVQDEYFIDIGIPEDYQKAIEELTPAALTLKSIDKSWTLFLDRDGVINYEKKGDYIRKPEEFRFYEGVLEAMKIFNKKFYKIVIVSNQRGVGKELMTENDLLEINKHLETEVESAGGRIDNIYYCTAVETTDPGRKPNPGMAYMAKLDFPGIDFTKSIMVGNKPGDMLFGRNAGMYTVYLTTTHPETAFPHPDIDLRFGSLADFAKACQLADRL
ncbi:MAG TPA: HAD-IIIA family hydrolase [Chitinophagaceae bacterium]|nr:HAD-IIIA family hydrolase [Chitinophagaceae bacterium]